MSVREVKAPDHLWVERQSVFLAGSIDMGAAPKWQPRVIEAVNALDTNVTIYNPRRDEWDASWEQSVNNPKFKEQVTWELMKMTAANIIFMYISAGSKAPISLLEFGYIFGKFPNKLIICVEKGFWRRGNIEVMCERQHINLYEDIDSAIAKLTRELEPF